MLTPLTPVQLADLESATAAYEASIDRAADYLATRGISKDVAALHRLGYVAEPVTGHEQYQGRLAIPYLTLGGVVDIRFRSLDPSASAKYLGRPGTTPSLYNVRALRAHSDVIVVCEGELDALTMDTLVGVPAVGVAGVNAWQPYWTRLFVDYLRVIVPCDGDEAGRGFGHVLAKQMQNVLMIEMPAGHDVNSLYLAEGAATVRAAIGVE